MTWRAEGHEGFGEFEHEVLTLQNVYGASHINILCSITKQERKRRKDEPASSRVICSSFFWIRSSKLLLSPPENLMSERRIDCLLSFPTNVPVSCESNSLSL